MKVSFLTIVSMFALFSGQLSSAKDFTKAGTIPMPVEGVLKGAALDLNYETKSGQKIGTLTGNYDDGSKMLFDLEINVDPKYRGRGVSKYIFSELFKKYPQAKILSVGLGEDNLLAFKKARLADADNSDALKSTPFYKSVSKFGFVMIDMLDADCLDLQKKQEDEASCNIVVQLKRE
ncbi:MAG: hypothetical protein EOP06_06200 [Proteobacteria bacterium]|nr:MAG: hypothetical protein EOP06_06200 [Pseudomonadota bacterium]